MKNIPELDTAIANPEIKVTANHTFFWAYRDSLEAEAEILDFSDVIWDTDIEPILADCKKYGVTEFTVSCNFSGLLETIAIFIEKGCKMEGLVNVNSRYIDIFTRKRKIIPALKISV